MESAMKMDDLMASAANASAKAMTSREDARVFAVRTIRILEARVQSTIAGDTIRGLSSLVGSDFGNFPAARVHGTRHGIRELLPLDGREVMVVTKNGHLAMARINREVRCVDLRFAEDEELTAQDLEPFVRAIARALEQHVVRAEKTAANYLRTLDLAHAIRDSLDALQT